MQHGNLPDEIDTKDASGARMYDYALGGTDNYAIDRMAIEHLEEMFPGGKASARNNRRFMERVVRFLAGECGIRQFIDNGSGLPTQNNVHQIAQHIDPACKVVYIDNDPVVLRHQKVSALAEDENTEFILADARNVEEILERPELTKLIDLSQPAATLYMGFLHFVPDDDDPWGLVRRMMERLAPGSYLAISHVASDERGARDRTSDVGREFLSGDFGRVREKQEVRAFFDGLEVIDPGLVNVAAWRPDGREEEESPMLMGFGGVGRKPS